MKLKWHQAPVKTIWGDEMVVASIDIDKDHTVDLYCERSQTAKVESMLLQAQQEPVAEVRLIRTGGNAGLATHIVQIVEGYFPAGTKLYTSPQQHEHCIWARSGNRPCPHVQPSKPLTDEQIGAVAADIWGSILIAPQSYQAFARAIEAAHGITGGQK